MFQEAAAIGGLDLQLVYYRGMRECSASRWVSDGWMLADLMAKIECRAGYTQLGRVLPMRGGKTGGERYRRSYLWATPWRRSS